MEENDGGKLCQQGGECHEVLGESRREIEAVHRIRSYFFNSASTAALSLLKSSGL
jgi:hypothetical protein